MPLPSDKIANLVDRSAAAFVKLHRKDSTAEMYFRVKGGPRSRALASIGPQIWYEGEDAETSATIEQVVSDNSCKIYQVLAFLKGESSPLDSLTWENTDYSDPDSASSFAMDLPPGGKEGNGIGIQAMALVRLAESADNRAEVYSRGLLNLIERLADATARAGRAELMLEVAQERAQLTDEAQNMRMLESAIGMFSEMAPRIVEMVGAKRKVETIESAVDLLLKELESHPELVASAEGQAYLARIMQGVNKATAAAKAKAKEAAEKAAAEGGAK